jgi:peptidoglycan/LPS O-acetylase OafA/YrhL
MQDGVFGTDWSFDAPSWCISICMLCYLLFYLILYHAKNEHRACYVFFGTFLIGMAMILSKKELPLWNSLVGRGIACFSVGAILFEVYKSRDKFRSQRLGYVCLIIAVLSYLAARLRPEFTGDVTTAFIIGTAPSLILAVLLIPWLRAILGFRPLAILGELSIVIYLVHFPVQCAIAVLNEYMSLELDFSTKAVWLIYAAAVLIAAIVYRYLVSSPAEKLICGFFAKKKAADSKKAA